MNLAKPLLLGELLLDVPGDDGQNKTEGPSEHEGRVLTVVAEDLLGADGTPEDGGGEEGVDARARHLVGGILGADVGDVVHLEVENAGADEGRDERGDDLGGKGVLGGDLDVVSEFEIVGEPDGVGAGDVAERLEEVHGESIAFNP